MLPNKENPKAAKEKAVENKYELMNVIQAIREGKMPHNAQLDDILNRWIENSVIKSREHLISADGRILLNDFRNLMSTLKKALSTKNKNELFQSMVYHLHCLDSPLSKDDLQAAAKNNADMGSMKQEGKKASDALWRIGKLVLMNNEFRSLLGDIIDLSQDIFSSFTTDMGNSMKKAGDQLQDQSPDQSGKEMVDSTIDKVQGQSDMGDSTMGTGDSTMGRMQGQSGMGDSTHGQRKRSSHLMSLDPNDPRHLGLLNTGDSVHPHAMSSGLSSSGQSPVKSPGGQDMASQKGQKMASQTGQMAREKIQEKVPDDKQDELIKRLKSALSQIQEHPDYQSAIETLVGLFKTWTSRATDISHEVQSRSTDDKDNRERAEREFKALMESWAQGHSMDPLIGSVQDMMNDVNKDETIRQYYHDSLDYINRLIREPGYAADDKSTQEGRELMDRGKQVLRENNHLEGLSNESRRYMQLLAEDGMSQELGDCFTRIHRDLWMDSAGDPAFKPHLLNDMRITLLPALMDEIRFIPVPRIEYSDKQFDVAIENLVISGDTLLPNVFDTKIESFNSFNLKSELSKPSSQSLMIRMSEIQADLDDIVFWYRKKSGFPKLEDRGVASMAVGGKGITIVLRLRDAVGRTFKVDYCKCHVDKLKLKVNDSHHDILYKTLTPLIMGTVRRQMAKSIETSIVDKLNALDQKITRSVNQFHQNMQTKAQESMPPAERGSAQPQHHSIWSTMVAVLNNNIKTKVANRNQKKKQDVDQKKKQDVDQKKEGMRPRPLDTSQKDKHLDSPPLSPTKMEHDHSNDYKLAVDLSEASVPTVQL